MPDPGAPEVLALVDAYQQAQSNVRDRVAAYIEAAWAQLDAWRDPDIARFVAQVIPVVQGAQRATASLTDAYLTRWAGLTGAGPGRPVGVPVALLAEVRGVPMPDVYQRVGLEVWTALSKGQPIEQAAARGLGRAQSLAGTDIQLAKTRATQHVLEQLPAVTGYRRVLNGPHSCGLCVVASFQLYHRQQLMPIHPGCDCGVEPVVGEPRPRRVQHVDAAHAAVRDRFGVDSPAARQILVDGQPVDYRDILITHDHGEIGPVLGVRGQHFTGPSGL